MILNYVKSPSRKSGKLIRGIGINDMELSTKIILPDGCVAKCPIYDIWVHMLERCTEKYQSINKHYEGTSVDQEWMLRSNFYEWMLSRDWYGKHLDKDILIIGNKMYSKHTCCLVPRHVNALLTDRRNFRGKYPLGVVYEKDRKKYTAQCNINGVKSKRLGSYCTAEEAHTAYQLAKAQEIRRVSVLYFNSGDIESNVYEALICRARILEENANNEVETVSLNV